MEPLLVLEDSETRQATPTEIYRAAERLCGRRFPRAFMLSSPRDVELFARWCLAPISEPCFLFVAADGGNHVLRYEVFPPCACAERVLAVATNVPAPAEPSARVWIVAAQPGAMDSCRVDEFGQQLRAHIARHHCKNVRYMRVQADRLPDCPSRRIEAEPLFFCTQQGGIVRPSTPQELVVYAHMLSARRLERGQLIPMWHHACAPIHLCAAPIDKPAIAALLLDEYLRFVHYQPIGQGNLHSALSRFDDFGRHAREWNARAAVLVCTQNTRFVPLTPNELTLLGRLSLAAEERSGVDLSTHAIVGLDRMRFYHTQLPHRPSQNSVAQERVPTASEIFAPNF